MIGVTVGGYRIVSKLSVGGMGTVYRAEHTLLGKTAAVKILHPELSGSRDLMNRFFNEAKATTTIKHPGIVDVFDYGYMESGDAYLTMEFLDGMSLARRLKTRGRTSEGEAAMLLRSVCNALAAAHDRGIVHRDLKPDNIFLVPDPESATGERPKILDFGIAKLTEPGLAGSATKTGAVMGTPTYMSPEQCRGTGEVDHRADLYSIGCIFYELMCGRPPFVSLGAGELLGAHLYVEPDPPSRYNRAITKETQALIMALLEKKPDRRPQTARELATRLHQLAQKLGWITSTSPNGITAEELRELPTVVPGGERTPAPVPTTEPPVAAATTPWGMTPAPSSSGVDVSLSGLDEAAQPDKPTTLSLAASQSVIQIKGSRRKGIGIALASFAIAAVGSFAIFHITRGGDDATSTSTPAATKPSDVKASDVKPSDVKPSQTKPSETKPSDVKPSETKPSETKPSDVKPSDVKPSDVKPSETKPSETKPSDTTTSDVKPAETKPAETKPADAKPPIVKKPKRTTPAAAPKKPTDTKPTETKPADTKPTETKPKTNLFEPNLD